MTIQNIDCTDDMRAIYGPINEADYVTEHDASEGATIMFADGNLYYLGQSFSGLYYTIYRLFLHFDTSVIDPNAIITSIKLRLCVNSKDYMYRDFDILVRNGQPTYPHLPLETGDYLYSHYSGNGGQINTADMNVSQYNDITLNAVGKSWINKGGYTKLALICSTDIAYDTPTDVNRIHITSYTSEPYKPRLQIEYFIPSETPTVETINEACEDRQATTLTAVGEITGTGDGYTVRGFEYYEYDSDNEYNYSMYAVREIGTFATPVEYRMTLYGLKPSTVYWIRAFAGNIFGISYGDWVLCSTTAVLTHTYNIYEEDNSGPDSDGTYAGGNTISFYVRKVGGKWSKKYGPYHSDQVDIAVADVMIEGTGKYQVKFESSALTGISTQVMCKLDVKAR